VSLNSDPPVANGSTGDMPLETLLDHSLDTIDIKPADRNNTINLATTATFQVAIFSRKAPDGTTVEVDATTIDPLSMQLRGIPPGPAWTLTVRGGGTDCKVQDPNRDGSPDFVCQFTWQPGPVVSPINQRAVLTGTTDGSGVPANYDFVGSDFIRFVN
jgi:hypothetical protein